MPAAFDLMAAAFDSIAAVFDPNTAALNQIPQNKFIPQHLLFVLHNQHSQKPRGVGFDDPHRSGYRDSVGSKTA